jgi:hypothetical protein
MVRARGPLDAFAGVVGDAAVALRRRREGRRPYVKLYDEAGDVQVIDPESDQAIEMIEVASTMVDAAFPRASGRRSEGA